MRCERGGRRRRSRGSGQQSYAWGDLLCPDSVSRCEFVSEFFAINVLHFCDLAFNPADLSFARAAFLALHHDLLFVGAAGVVAASDFLDALKGAEPKPIDAAEVPA